MASATSSRALPWFTPVCALLVGGVLVVLTVIAFRWTVDADPGQSCPGDLGVPALTLSGTPERSAQILACDAFTNDAVRSTTTRDFALIAAYVAAIVFWCAYGAIRARRRATEQALWTMAAMVVFAGLLDVAEDIVLLNVFSGSPSPDALSSGEATALFALSLSRWVVLAIPFFAAIGIIAGTLSRFARTAWGPSTWPAFLGSLPNVREPQAAAHALRTEPTSAEAARLRFQRPGASEPADPVGICVSGGGIRAGSFALGALQSLINAKVYERADYLASVSGGGYLAGASQIVAAFDDEHGTNGRKPFAAADDGHDVPAPEVGYVADHARFLWPPPTPDPGRSTRRFISSAFWGLLGILFNIVLVLGVVYVIAVAAGWLLRGLFTSADGTVERVLFPGFWWALPLMVLGLGPLVGRQLRNWLAKFRPGATGHGILSKVALVAVMVAVTIAIGVLARYGLPAHVWWSDRSWWQRVLIVGGFFVVAAIASKLFDGSLKSIPAITLVTALFLAGANWMESAIDTGREGDVTWQALLTVGGILAGLVAFILVAAALRFVPLLPVGPWRRHKAASVIGLALLAVVIGVAFGIWLAAQFDDEAISNTLGSAWAVWAAVAGGLAVVIGTLDQKRWSPHPIYKRRLAGTFSPVRYVEDGTPSAAALPYGVRTTLSRWARHVPGHPKLLVCGAAYDTVNVSGEMRAWPFVFSDDYVGGSDVGWVRTLDFEAALGKSNAPDGTLLAAMAISGAAVSPGLGQIDLGTLNIVLSFVNARLGVWLPNPPYINELRGDHRFPSREGPALRWLRTRRATYLFKELFGVHDREDRFLYVTDGGQLDNLGMLELLSRRCRLIVSFDASGDELLSTNTFDGVRQLAWERYRVRFSQPGGEPDPSCADPATYDGPPLKVTNKRVTPTLDRSGRGAVRLA